MIFAQERKYSSQCACIKLVAGKVRCSSQTLNGWVSRTETELGRRHGVTQSEQDRLKTLERENKSCAERTRSLIRRSSILPRRSSTAARSDGEFVDAYSAD